MSETYSITDVRAVAGQLYRYGVAGGLALCFHLSVLAVLVDGFGQDQTAASASGFVCAVPINYLLQRFYVFRSSAGIASSFMIYCAVTLAALAVNTAAFWVLAALIGLHYLVAQPIATGIVVLLNFLVNRNLTFAARGH